MEADGSIIRVIDVDNRITVALFKYKPVALVEIFYGFVAYDLFYSPALVVIAEGIAASINVCNLKPSAFPLEGV